MGEYLLVDGRGRLHVRDPEALILSACGERLFLCIGGRDIEVVILDPDPPAEA
jgi:hypothetical protein